MATGPWIPGEHDNSDPLTDFFIAWTDYRGHDDDESGMGGNLCIVRATRETTSDPWVPGNNIVLYQEDPGVNNINMHFHTGGILFPEDDRMVVVLSIGDNARNNRIVMFERENYSTYDQGYNPTDRNAPTAANPSDPGGANESKFPPAIPVPTSGTQNGWKTYEDRNGQRARLFFTDADYNAGSKTLTSTAFANYTHPASGVTPIIARRPNNPNILEISGIASRAGNVLTLTHAFQNVGTPLKLSGYLASDSSIQCMAQLPTADRNALIWCGDEQSDYLTRVEIDAASKRLTPSRIMGVPTDLMVPTDPDIPQDATGNWLIFLAQCRYPGEGLDYAALLRPGSIGGWIGNNSAATLLFSRAGGVWGQMLKMPAARDVPCCFAGDRYFIGDFTTVGLTSIPVLTPSRIREMQPIAISGGAVNELVQTGTPPKLDYLPDEEIPTTTDGFYTTFTAVGRDTTNNKVDLAGFNIPLPPCKGPIMRATIVDSNYLGVWKLTNEIDYENALMRFKFWVHMLPCNPDQTNPNITPPAGTAGGLRMQFGWIEDDEDTIANNSQSRPFDTRAVGGAGWVPFTAWSLLSEFFVIENNQVVFSPPDMPCILGARVSSVGRQDFLIAFDSVILGENGMCELPEMPLLIGPQSTTGGETLVATYASLPSSTSWSFFAACMLGRSGPDVFTEDRAADPNIITLLTLKESGSLYLRVVLDRAAKKIKLIDNNGASIELSGPTTPFAQPFYFLRDTQILIGVTQFRLGSPTVTTYHFYASIGGSAVVSASSTSLATVRPASAMAGDQNSANIDSALHFCWHYNDAAIPGTPELYLQNLSFI
ncbi:MAG: hypothetical protein IT435_11365 [Phycisphaerales bacterium]|nr:hypothetical protein [Phycisphaerales bacterium]